MSAIPVKSILRKFGITIVKKFRLARVAERFVKEREKKDPTLGILVLGGRSSRGPNAVSYKQLGNCADVIDANMEFCSQEAWDLHNIFLKSKGLMFNHVQNSSDLLTGQLKRKVSHLGQIANMKIKNLLWTAPHLST